MTALDLLGISLAALPILFGLSFVIFIQERRGAKHRFWNLASFLLSVAVLVNMGIMAVATVAAADAGKSLVERLLNDVFNLSLFTFILGVLLFLFRRSDRALYGAAEIVFAMGTAAFIGWQADGGTLTRLLGVAGALYIIVRGLDNLDVGLKSAKLTPFAAWIRRNVFRNSPELASAADQITEKDQCPRVSGADGS